MFIWIELDEI